MKPTIYDYTQDELSGMIKPIFRVKQIWNWLYHRYAQSFDNMKNLPKDLRAGLENDFSLEPLKIVTAQLSRDGSIKYLFRLRDGTR